MENLNRRTVNRLLSEWTDHGEMKPSSKKKYIVWARAVFNYFWSRRIYSPSAKDVKRWVCWAMETKKMRPSTINNYLTALRMFFAWLDNEGVCKNICFGIKRLKIGGTHARGVLSEHDFHRICGGFVGTPAGLRDRAMFLLLFCAAMRRIEICRLRIIDFYAEKAENQRFFLQVSGKGYSGVSRITPLLEIAATALQDWLNCRRELGFSENEKESVFVSLGIKNYGKSLHPDTVSRIIKRILRENGLNSSRFTTHSLRHSAATLLFQMGIPITTVQQILGHSDIRTTSIYLRHTPSEKQVAIERFSAYIGEITNRTSEGVREKIEDISI